MLEGRRDLAVLWDIRVSPETRRKGVGSALFEMAEAWARLHELWQLMTETQNINVGAQLYRTAGMSVAGDPSRGVS